MASPPLPLTGTLVLDLSRMLPGAVLTRVLVDLGARVIKIEDPRTGDLMRHAAPLVEGVGAGFQAFMRGTESLTLDLRTPADAEVLRALARRADVLVESFRPGTLTRWGLGPEQLAAINPALVVCSLSGFGTEGSQAHRVAHDLNLVAASGLLSQLPPGMPRVQIADVATGLLACSAVLASLLARHNSGRGRHLDQPLAMGPLPFLTWAWADQAAGGGEDGLLATLLAGEAGSYGLYVCADGRSLAMGAIEPKFWVTLMEAIGLSELGGDGMETAEKGAAVRSRVAARLAEEPREHWLALADDLNLPLTAVNSLAEAAADPAYQGSARQEDTPLAGGGSLGSPAAYLPSFTGGSLRPAPRLGADNARIFAEFGIEGPVRP